ncbi:MAG: bifunctional homocysteine S-methyltransferase/methylenetetrahydrofolate reductase [Ignavibacteriales bacterium]|nr:bifunctional homocysteine S-methyltransferase/methylenetetrahydrofolate reductase [Ignavibacteriales bacterium]
MKLDFRQRLKQGPILCDGAMGTLLDLYEYNELPHEIQNIKNPDIVERIHREYIEAGAEIIQTNTFSGNRWRLSQFHNDDKIVEINKAGVEIARRAAGDSVYVAGSVGPTGKLLEPIGKLELKQARDAFKEQIEVLLKAGVDLLILETFVSLTELDEAITAAKDLTNIPIVAQKAFPEDGAILSGTFPVEVVEHIMSRGVDVVGANCTVGPQRMFSIIRSMYKDGIVLSAQPAAGIPTLLNGRSIYHTTPEYLAQYAKELLQAGVTLVGACCGSTPAHIRAIKNVMEELKQRGPGIKTKDTSAPKKNKGRGEKVVVETLVEPDSRSRFARNIGKKFLTTVELDIPRGLDISSLIEGARYLQQYGIDAINITDGARARLRMSSIAISYQIQTQVGIEAMTHMATRDRNMIGVQAELLGAHALGLRNILCITGDPTNIGDYPQATSVFDLDSPGLIRAVKSMNEGKDLMGNTIEQKASFLIACAVNAMADNMDAEMEKLEKKIDAGVDIAFTQPVYDMKTLEQLIMRTSDWKIPVMLGLLPLRSYKHAEFLHNEIPGMTIPETIRKKMHSAGDKGAEVGIEIAVSFLNEAKSEVAGVYLLPAFKKYDIVPKILKGIGMLEEERRMKS